MAQKNNAGHQPGGQKQAFLEALAKQQMSQEQQRLEILRRMAFLRQKETIEKKSSPNLLYNASERQTKEEIAALRQEIKKLAKKVVHVQANIDRAVNQRVSQPSRYELSFWQHLHHWVRQLVEKIDSVDLWLQEWNRRRRKKGDFWGIVSNKKRGGAQFLLSAEHYMTRSAG